MLQILPYQRSLRFLQAVTLLGWAMCASWMPTSNAFAGSSRTFAKSPLIAPGDEIFLLSTRSMGTVCDDLTMRSRLSCEKTVVKNSEHRFRWVSNDWHEAVSETDDRLTIVYIHGNRVSRGEDRARGLQVYRSLLRQGRPNQPIRFIIWSWPSSEIKGPIKDYQVKAQRTRPVAWQLAWFLDQLPSDTEISLIGYSYGARVASGALHLLAGGTLGGLRLEAREHLHRNPFRVALVAAAFNADWIQPGHFHGRAVSQTAELVLGTNRLDPAMRFFHLGSGRGHMDALGRWGVVHPQAFGAERRKMQSVDFTHAVGRSHALGDYLSASQQMRFVWRHLLPAEKNTASASKAPVLSKKS